MITQCCKDVISQHHGLAITSICLLKTRSIPKTTSGKIARAWCRKAFLDKKLQILYSMDGDNSNSNGSTSVAVTTSSSGSSKEKRNGTDIKKVNISSNSGSGGYSRVYAEEEAVIVADDSNNSNNMNTISGVELVNNPSTNASSSSQLQSSQAPLLIQATASEIRAMPIPQLVTRLEQLILQVSSQGPSPLTAPVDSDIPVTAMGLDSMTLVQFKGVIEKR